jgi:hypothetical protein
MRDHVDGGNRRKIRTLFLQGERTPDANDHAKENGNRFGDYSCLYGNYQKFWEYFFPRDLRCLQEGHRKLEGKVVELSLDPIPDPALFVQPAGAIEAGKGGEHPIPARHLPARDLEFPF